MNQENKEKEVQSKQIRVEVELHRKLKTYASKKGLTLTRLITRMSKEYFDGPDPERQLI